MILYFSLAIALGLDLYRCCMLLLLPLLPLLLPLLLLLLPLPAACCLLPAAARCRCF